MRDPRDDLLVFWIGENVVQLLGKRHLANVPRSFVVWFRRNQGEILVGATRKKDEERGE